jgi:hypothetical protein
VLPGLTRLQRRACISVEAEARYETHASARATFDAIAAELSGGPRLGSARSVLLAAMTARKEGMRRAPSLQRRYATVSGGNLSAPAACLRGGRIERANGPAARPERVRRRGR